VRWRSANHRINYLYDLPREVAASERTFSAFLREGATLTQVARGRLPSRQSLVFLWQHDGNNGFTVIARAEDKFQGEPLALGAAPIAGNALQLEQQVLITVLR